MSNFNNEAYEGLVSDLIGDVFYVETSYRGKVSKIRQYTEVIVRKLLDIEQTKDITLGRKFIQQKIETIPNYTFVENALKNIKDDGNTTTHTQYLGKVSKEDFEKAVDSLFDMLAILLINYFEKYEFGTRSEVLYSFSILPPIIRYKVLIFLHNKFPDNISIIDKLVLAIMKAFSVDEANEWVENRKERLSQMKTISEKAFQSMVEQYGKGFAETMECVGPQNMYVLCKQKISELSYSINTRGALYTDFESALPYYKKHGILKGDDAEIKEFNDIMEFLYLGRKERLQELDKAGNQLIVLKYIVGVEEERKK